WVAGSGRNLIAGPVRTSYAVLQVRAVKPSSRPQPLAGPTTGSVTAVSGVAQTTDAVALHGSPLTSTHRAAEGRGEADSGADRPSSAGSSASRRTARPANERKGVCSSETRRRPALWPAFSLNRPLGFLGSMPALSHHSAHVAH